MSEAPAPRRPWYRLGGADAVFLVLCFVIFQSARGRMLSDPGLGWHLRNVDAMRAQGGWLTADPFSGPRAGQPWLTNQWLGELPLWLGERWAGLEGIAAVATLVLAFTFRCLYRMLLRDGLPWPAAALWTCLAALATSCSWVARPNLFTLLFVLLTARACEQLHAGRWTWRRALWLVPLFAVWANTHGGFVAGLLVLGFTLFLEAGQAALATDPAARVDARRRAGVFAGLLAGCFLATLVNPYGTRLYAWVFKLLGDSYFMELHHEWRSPLFHGKGAFQFESLILLFPLLMGVSKRRPNVVELGLSVLLLHFALTGLRFLPLWVLVATPLLARSSVEVPAVARLLRRLRESGQGGGLFAAAPARAPGGWSVIVAALLLLSSRPLEGRFASLLPEVVPAAALDRMVAEHRRRPDAVVFHSYDWGGYLTWRGWSPDGPSLKTWIDDRNEVQGREHVEDYFAILAAEPGWDAKLDRAGVAFVCVHPGAPLAGRLAGRPGWEEIYRDDFAALFERATVPPDRRPSAPGPEHARAARR
jgi:hypothetical protein